VVHMNRLYLTVLATVKAPCNVSIGKNVQVCRFCLTMKIRSHSGHKMSITGKTSCSSCTDSADGVAVDDREVPSFVRAIARSHLHLGLGKLRSAAPCAVGTETAEISKPDHKATRGAQLSERTPRKAMEGSLSVSRLYHISKVVAWL